MSFSLCLDSSHAENEPRATNFYFFYTFALFDVFLARDLISLASLDIQTILRTISRVTARDVPRNRRLWLAHKNYYA